MNIFTCNQYLGNWFLNVTFIYEVVKFWKFYNFQGYNKESTVTAGRDLGSLWYG